MTYQPEAIRIADGLDQNVQIDPKTSEDEPGGYRSELDELMADAAAILRSQHARIAELEAENKQLRILASGGIDLFERYSTFKAKCEELEAMLDAIGAGGVGQSIKPQVQADAAQAQQKPVAWRVRPFNYGIGHEGVDALTTRKEQCEMWERKGWKVEPLYAAPQPARQPLTNEQIIAIADNARAAESGDAGYILPIAFARAIEAAYGITGSQQ